MRSLRLDRLATVHFFHPRSRGRAAQLAGRIPILMYHAIQDQMSGGAPYYETSTSPSVFARHMKFLNDNGYSTLTLDQAVSSLGNPHGNKRPVVVTFDDGYQNFYTTAYPIMQAYGFTATVFLITGLTADRRQRFQGIDCLTWSEAREMQASGVSIGSHTVTHPVLADMNQSAIASEIGGSKQEIEDRLGARVRSFSYPFAFPEADNQFVSCLAETLEKHGYENGVSTVIGTAGPADSRYFLPRIPINTWDDVALFRAKLEGGYDWLHVPQSIYKTVRRATPKGC